VKIVKIVGKIIFILVISALLLGAMLGTRCYAGRDCNWAEIGFMFLWVLPVGLAFVVIFAFARKHFFSDGILGLFR
jgi:hypothetical protein